MQGGSKLGLLFGRTERERLLSLRVHLWNVPMETFQKPIANEKVTVDFTGEQKVGQLVSAHYVVMNEKVFKEASPIFYSELDK